MLDAYRIQAQAGPVNEQAVEQSVFRAAHSVVHSLAPYPAAQRAAMLPNVVRLLLAAFPRERGGRGRRRCDEQPKGAAPMTTRWPCLAVSTTLSCLLAVATSASATNAWILWEEQGMTLALGGQVAVKTDWKIYKAYGDQEKCETDLVMLDLGFHATKKDETLANGTKISTGPLKEGVVGYLHFVIVDTQNSKFEIHKFSCLPDAVDPRGPR